MSWNHGTSGHCASCLYRQHYSHCRQAGGATQGELRACRSHMVAYKAPLASSCAWVPTSATRPPSSTTMLSASVTVLSRCATTSVVHLRGAGALDDHDNSVGNCLSVISRSKIWDTKLVWLEFTLKMLQVQPEGSTVWCVTRHWALWETLHTRRCCLRPARCTPKVLLVRGW